MEENGVNNCLKILQRAGNDNERMAALLLVTKLTKADSCSGAERKQLFEAVGFSFIIRLLKSGQVPDGCAEDAFRNVALSILSAFCSEPSLVTHPEMLNSLPCLHEVILKDASTDKTETELPDLLRDAYDCLTCICVHREGQMAAIEHGTASVLGEVYHNGLCGRERALELALMLAERHGSPVFAHAPHGLMLLLNKLSCEFTETQEKEKFELCSCLGQLVSSVDRLLLDELPSRTWSMNVHNGLMDVLQSRISSSQREPALQLASVMVQQCGVDWALYASDKGVKFLLLLAHLACIEVRMALEDRSLAEASTQEAVLSACYALLESTIAFMTVGASLALNDRQITQLHSAMVGAFHAASEFLALISQDEQPEIWFHPVVTATVRVLGSWIAEESLALEDKIRDIIPFLLKISRKTFLQTKQGTLVHRLQALALGETIEEAKTEEAPPPATADVLRFLLPGFCHLSAEEKSRSVLMESGISSLLVDYTFFHWEIFSEDSACRPSEVALTTMSGIFLNLIVMNDEKFTCEPVSEKLLRLLLNNISCFSHSSPTHLVLFYNWAVLGLMLLRKMPQAFAEAEDDCAAFIQSVTNLFSHAHIVDHSVPEPRDPPIPHPRLNISSFTASEWPAVAELWFLGMQTLSHLIDQHNDLAKIILKSSWLLPMLRMLIEIKGNGVDSETAISYRSLLLAVARASPRAFKVIKERGGIKVSRLYKFDDLEKLLTR
ncbi:hypothetical protein CAPTEDRAFT_171922 [Capitella teleta]|uniref:Neurochondrin n=1 Tax=Capitella teleta TaxID=283909 RepID=R7VE39_CAPTE|nr:hypothetical protein CAPTEDRAFT_171922 [Capitella teleta]|eukprot:ELU16894.1 hypothetical protein CAPTEDRAFT_171922 [Capitella teleta]